MRRFMLSLAFAIVSVLSAASLAQAATHPRPCTTVIVGKYQAHTVRVVKMNCAVASARLHTWLHNGTKSLPHDSKRWHAKHVRSSIWEVLYGRKPGPSVTFTLVVVVPPAPKVKPVVHVPPKPAAVPSVPKPNATPTSPTISMTSPASGASYTWGQAASAQFSCSASVPMASCTATVGSANVANGAALPTSGAPGPGTRALTVTAVDSSGNKSTKSVNYVVQPAGYYGIELHDGPNADFTQKALDALASVNAKANFFLIGENVQANQALAQEEVARGMLIGNHTQTHADVGPATIGNPAVASPFFVIGAGPVAPDTAALEIQNGATSIINATGVTPTLFMPPYGDYGATTDTTTVQSMVTSLTGETLCAWTVDSMDSASPLPPLATIVANAETVQPGGMIEMHDFDQETVDAIVPIVTDLRNTKGLEPGKMYADPTLSVPGPFGDPQPAFHCGVQPF